DAVEHGDLGVVRQPRVRLADPCAPRVEERRDGLTHRAGRDSTARSERVRYPNRVVAHRTEQASVRPHDHDPRWLVVRHIRPDGTPARVVRRLTSKRTNPQPASCMLRKAQPTALIPSVGNRSQESTTMPIPILKFK